MIFAIAKLALFGLVVWWLFRAAEGRDERVDEQPRRKRSQKELKAGPEPSAAPAKDELRRGLGVDPENEEMSDAGGITRSASDRNATSADVPGGAGSRRRSWLLALDGVANLLFGIVLLAAPRPLFGALGLPWTGRGLYATILGGVLVGIGLALILESRGRVGRLGLGLGGAVAINMIAGMAIAAWLLFSGAGEVSSAGRAVLWLLVLFLVGLSIAEIVAHRHASSNADL